MYRLLVTLAAALAALTPGPAADVFGPADLAAARGRDAVRGRPR